MSGLSRNFGLNFGPRATRAAALVLLVLADQLDVILGARANQVRLGPRLGSGVEPPIPRQRFSLDLKLAVCSSASAIRAACSASST